MKINKEGFFFKNGSIICLDRRAGILCIWTAFKTTWQWGLIFGTEIKLFHRYLVWATHSVNLFPQSTLTPGLFADRGYHHSVAKKRGIQISTWFKGLGDCKREKGYFPNQFPMKSLELALSWGIIEWIIRCLKKFTLDFEATLQDEKSVV